ncbi:DUF1642 domain-containing protein [Streptococcus agalactiae]|uniref:DUF1642 domain-containing protein n=1 Tax=Streptococcus agalactiae TaxID=1311 RepID=UPI001374D2CB|nr:DUF1642 domain-containing protein [Streptococcus agalactiae]KAF1166397.1 hypothetical protein B8V22_05930 [Streptococcus agalactiae]
MNIEEAKKAIRELDAFNYCDFKGNLVRKIDVLSILDQIDKPQPEVPQIIFDIIKKFKDENRSFYSLLENISAVKETWEWLNTPKAGAKESDLMQAWLAYSNITVQKEKLYTVEIPDPNYNESVVILSRNLSGYISIAIANNKGWRDRKANQLTESEIRKDFDWAWQWAKEVRNDII